MPGTVYVMIDAGYLDDHKRNWSIGNISVGSLCGMIADRILTDSNFTQHKYQYYDCLPYVDKWTKDREAQLWQEEIRMKKQRFFNALEDRQIAVIQGELAPRGDDGLTKIYDYKWARSRRNGNLMYVPRDSNGSEIYFAQKKVDTEISTNIMVAALTDSKPITIAILSGDSDLIAPVIRARAQVDVSVVQACAHADGKNLAHRDWVANVDQVIPITRDDLVSIRYHKK